MRAIPNRVQVPYVNIPYNRLIFCVPAVRITHLIEICMSGEALTIYRCLRSERSVAGGVHDECADIIARNPNVDFRPGLTGIEVDHQVHQYTHWDADFNNYPLSYAEQCQGRLGHIIVSIRLDLLESADLDWDDDPNFYQPDYYTDNPMRNWYIAGRTAVVRVRVERVVQVAVRSNSRKSSTS